MADIREYKKMKEQKSNVVSGKSRFNVQPLPPSAQKGKNAPDDTEYDDTFDDEDYSRQLKLHRIRV